MRMCRGVPSAAREVRWRQERCPIRRCGRPCRCPARCVRRSAARGSRWAATPGRRRRHTGPCGRRRCWARGTCTARAPPAGQPVEIGQAVGDERHQVRRAPRIVLLEYAQRAVHFRPVGPGRRPFQRRGQENGVHRRQLELHVGAVILRRNREKGGNIKLDVGRDDGSADTHRGEREWPDRFECAERDGQRARPLEGGPPGSWAPGNPTVILSLPSQSGATNRERRTGGTILGDAGIAVNKGSSEAVRPLVLVSGYNGSRSVTTSAKSGALCR